MPRTQLSGFQVLNDSITGEDVREESLVDSKIPFYDARYIATNEHDAILEANNRPSSYKNTLFYNSSKSNTTDAYINYFTYNNSSNGIVGDYLLNIEFMYKISSSSYYLQYRIKVNDVVVEERKIYTANADSIPTNNFKYKVSTTTINENIKVELDFKVEQPFWGSSTGTIYKAVVTKELM